MRISDWSADVCSSVLGVMRLARFGEFEQTVRAARFGARYRAGSDEVAGARAGAVDGKMRKELRRVPIQMREVAFCYPDRSDAAPPHLGRLEMDLEPNVEVPIPLVPKIVGDRGLRLGDRKSTRLNSSNSCQARMRYIARDKKEHHMNRYL